MKIKNAVEVTIKQLGLEMYNVALDSMTEIELFQVLSMATSMQRDILEMSIISQKNKSENEKSAQHS